MTCVDGEQLRQLVNRHGAALVLYARQWCRAPDDALQEALIELLRQNPAPDHPVAWLYKTVRRRAMNWSRAEQRRSRHQLRAGEERESWFVPRDVSGGQDIDLEPCLQRLSQLEREIVVARVWGELSLQEIAELVECSVSSVHRRHQKALEKLQVMINGEASSSQQTGAREDVRPSS